MTLCTISALQVSDRMPPGTKEEVPLGRVITQGCTIIAQNPHTHIVTIIIVLYAVYQIDIEFYTSQVVPRIHKLVDNIRDSQSR